MCLKNKKRIFTRAQHSSIFLLVFVTFNLTNSNLYALTISRSVSEYEVKAAFLYNIAKFVEWPAERFSAPDEALIIGIYGKDPFGPILNNTIKGKTIRGRTIVIKRFKLLKRIEFCHILFVSSSKEKYLKKILAVTKDWNCLTVGDTNRFAQNGGIIGFALEKRKVHFSINIKAAEIAGLKISSNLLKIANIINVEKYKED